MTAHEPVEQERIYTCVHCKKTATTEEVEAVSRKADEEQAAGATAISFWIYDPNVNDYAGGHICDDCMVVNLG